MSSYHQYKKHIYDKKKNGPYCHANPSLPEYAKDINDINCQHCLKYLEEVKREIDIEKKNKAQ